MHLHIRVHPSKRLPVPISPSRGEFSLREIQPHERVARRGGIIRLEPRPERGGGVLRRGTPASVDDVFVAAFAEQQAGFSLEELSGEGAGVDVGEEGWGDE